MLTKILKTMRELRMTERGERVMCALSGGADSSVLLDALIKLSEKLDISVCAAHLNHMLRGADADSDEAFVREKCASLGIPLVCERIDINSLALKTGQSTELAARNARYDFLQRAKETLGADKIATAHNANDNLETILFNISRGGGIDGVCGIPPVRGDIIRPLTGVSRSEIEQYAEDNKIAFCTDKTNAETIYSRNKIRHNVIPSLLEINPSAIENAARSSIILRKESAFLRNAAKLVAKELALDDCSCKRYDLLKVDDALFGRVCEHFAANACGEGEYTLSFRHVEDIRRICESDVPSKKIALPCGVTARCEYEKLVFEKAEEISQIEKTELSVGTFESFGYSVFVRKSNKDENVNNSVNTFLIPCDRIYGKLTLRSRAEGDEIKLKKRPTKSIKKLLCEMKVPKHKRERIPVIADDEKVFGIFGFGADVRYTAEKSEDALVVEIKEIRSE